MVMADSKDARSTEDHAVCLMSRGGGCNCLFVFGLMNLTLKTLKC